MALLNRCSCNCESSTGKRERPYSISAFKPWALEPNVLRGSKLNGIDIESGIPGFCDLHLLPVTSSYKIATVGCLRNTTDLET